MAIDSNYLEKLETNDAATMTSSDMFIVQHHTSNSYIIPIKAWIYRRDDGTGNISPAQLNQIIENLNNLYRPRTNLRFYLRCDITEINSTDIATSPENNFDNFVQNNRATGAMNVHFAINSTAWAGRAQMPWDNPSYACAVTQSFSTLQEEANSLGHEIRHTLGLYHTHHPGRNNNHEKNEDCGDCYQEAVSRSKKQGLACVSTVGDKKCEVNGDFLCDTEADPALQWNDRPPPSYVDGCTYNRTGGTDEWGDQWRPVVSNIMSFAPRNCRNFFSPLQVSKMYGYLDGIGSPAINFAISGPDQLCTGQTATYTVNALPGDPNYTWQVPPSLTILDGQGTNTITVQATGDWGGQITITPSCGYVATTLTLRNLSSFFITGPEYGCPGQYITYEAPYFPNAYYNWTITDGYIASGQGTNWVQVYLYSNPGNAYILEVSTTAPCDNTQTLYSSIYIQEDYNCSIYTITQKGADTTVVMETTPNKKAEAKELLVQPNDIGVDPNPAKSSARITIPGNEVYDLVVMNAVGQTVLRKNNVQRWFDLNVAPYNNGLYFIYIIGKDRTYSKKLIIKK